MNWAVRRRRCGSGRAIFGITGVQVVAHLSGRGLDASGGAGGPPRCGSNSPASRNGKVSLAQCCPEAVGEHVARSAPTQAPPAASGVHEVWQVDHQEKQVLGDGTYATVCNIRDPVGAAMIASQAFSTKTAKCKASCVRLLKNGTPCRSACLRITNSAWRDLFPSRLTLWLCGLGIVHQRIRPINPPSQPR